MNRSLAQLCQRIGYEFRDPQLLDVALRHRSGGGDNNERLEFLGDALLDLAVSEELYALRPDAPEGDLSRLRASLVKRASLAQLAGELGVGEHLHLGSGEMKSGGHRRDSILADALEALLGAVFLDGGYEPARQCVLRVFAQRFADLPDARSLLDPKTRLQELLQARGLDIPSYRVVEVSGEDHARRFEVQCDVAGLGLTATGAGSSRRRAEQKAAAQVLEQVSDAA